MRPVPQLKGSQRLTISLADAGMSSLGNLALSWCGAKFLGVSDFGLLSVAMTVGLLVQGVAKTALIDGFTLQYSSRGRVCQEIAMRDALGAVVVVSSVISVLAVVSVLLLAGSGLFVAISAMVVPLAVQDATRWSQYVRGDPTAALFNTTCWTLLTFIGVGALLALDEFNPVNASLVWGLAAGVSAVLTFGYVGFLPRLVGTLGWIRESRSIGINSSVDYGLTQVVGFGGGLLIAGLAGASAYGTFRLAQLPLSVIQIAITGGIAFLQPALVVRVAEGNRREARSTAWAAACGIAGLTVVTTSAVMLLPEHVMVTSLGESWPAARPLVPVMALGLIASGVAATFGPYLRAVGQIRYEVRCKIVFAPFAFVSIGAGALLFGAMGGTSAQAAVTIGLAVVFVLAATRGIGGRDPDGPWEASRP